MGRLQSLGSDSLLHATVLIGKIFHVLCVGSFPFLGEHEEQKYKKVRCLTIEVSHIL